MSKQNVEFKPLQGIYKQHITVDFNLRIHPENISVTELQNRCNFVNLQCLERLKHVLTGRLS